MKPHRLGRTSTGVGMGYDGSGLVCTTSVSSGFQQNGPMYVSPGINIDMPHVSIVCREPIYVAIDFVFGVSLNRR